MIFYIIMDIMEDKAIARHLFEKYCSNPRNWNFVISTSSLGDGFFDAMVSNTDEVWQLKLDSIYKPLPLVVGTKIDMDSTTIERGLSPNSVPFGFRKLEPPVIMDILKKVTEEQEARMNVHNAAADFDDQLYSILRSLKTVKPTGGNNYAYGPFIFTSRTNLSPNEYHKRVSEKLAMKLRDNLRNKYSSYG
ncbi:MAG TPA: hypothetical protein VE593_01890 [Nitrososphaeraceae archaeon]|nr:hypothetical protein [Nitrososphaeraceae archaeon]